MKTIIIIALLSFVISTGVTMFLTGTLSQITVQTSQNSESEEMDLSEDKEETKNQDQKQSENQSEEEMAKTPSPNSEMETKLEKYKTQIDVAEAELATLKAEIESFKNVKASLTRSQQLAKVYGAMKPESAASILCSLEEDLSTRILSAMSDKEAGKIMEAVVAKDPAYGAEISKLMANENISKSIN